MKIEGKNPLPSPLGDRNSVPKNPLVGGKSFGAAFEKLIKENTGEDKTKSPSADLSQKAIPDSLANYLPDDGGTFNSISPFSPLSPFYQKTLASGNDTSPIIGNPENPLLTNITAKKLADAQAAEKSKDANGIQSTDSKTDPDHMATILFRLKSGYYSTKAMDDALTDKLSGFFDDLAE